MAAQVENVNMFQFSTRKIDEEEPLRMMDVNGVHIWMDEDDVPVIVDLPNNFNRFDYVK